MPELTIPLTPTTSARLELVAMEPAGMFRLTVEHPATRIVEYYASSTDALSRWEELQMALTGDVED